MVLFGTFQIDARQGMRENGKYRPLMFFQMKLLVSSILLLALVPNHYHVLTKSLHHHGPSSSPERQSNCKKLQSLGERLAGGWASSCGAAEAEAGAEDECVLATVEVIRTCSRGKGANLDQACLDHLLNVSDL